MKLKKYNFIFIVVLFSAVVGYIICDKKTGKKIYSFLYPHKSYKKELGKVLDIVENSSKPSAELQISEKLNLYLHRGGHEMVLKPALNWFDRTLKS